MSVASEDTGLDEESESCDIKSQSGVSTASSSAYSSGINQSEKGSQNDLETMSEVSNTENDLTVAMAQESEYSNIEIGDIQDDKSEQSSLSTQENRYLTIRSSCCLQSSTKYRLLKQHLEKGTYSKLDTHIQEWQ